ncbi:hypothetical protein R3P38DRAFT_313671 [Favolaschia claudopus]|uniref:Uncharacterized protein n=1 Tax=Favolaschia claudopus TaxID=2862362 RepID=A0AAW0CWA9_9AGAR
MFFNKSVLFSVAALVSAVVAAPITSTPGGAANIVSPVETCDVKSLQVAVDNMVEFAQGVLASQGAFNQDPFVFFNQGKKVFPDVVTALTDAQAAVKANDLKTVATKIQFVDDQLATIPVDFQDGQASVADENLVNIAHDIVIACADQLN